MEIIPADKNEDDELQPRYDLTTPYSLTRFGVYPNYGIYDHKERGLILSFFDADDIRATYNPLNMQLDIELAKINTADYNSILAFCLNYGIPTDDDYNNKDGAFHTYECEAFGGNRTIHSVEVKFLIEEINALKFGVKAWQTLKKGSYSEINSLAQQFREESKKWPHRWDHEETIKTTLLHLGSRKAYTSNFDPYKLFQSVKDSEPEQQLTAYLFLLTAMGMRGIFWRTQIIKSTIVPAIYFKTPIDAAWFQLSRSITQNTVYRQCENPKCSNIFAVTNDKQRFCPPSEPGKRSKCENAYNQAKHRERVKSKEGE